MSIERQPLTDASQLEALDANEKVEGYLDGFSGEPEPGDNRSLSYWHGWRNGAVDGGFVKKDAAQALLARSVVQQMRAKP